MQGRGKRYFGPLGRGVNTPAFKVEQLITHLTLLNAYLRPT
jgi:hypothetical protein